MTVVRTSATKSPRTDTIYSVQLGDTLASIAERWYGDRAMYTELARRNQLPPTHILYAGQQLVIPAIEAAPAVEGTVLPASPGNSAPITYDNQVIETVTTTASVWWKDWRYLAGIALGVGALWWIASRRK